MTRLRNCEACARHVFADEPVCPFCKAELAPAPEPAPIAVPSGASRAQRLALAAAIGGTSLLACAETNPGGGVLPITPPPAGTSAPPPGQPAAGRGGFGVAGGPIAVPVYGVPISGGTQAPVPQAGRSSQPAAGTSGNIPPVAPAYGAPIAGNPSEDDGGVAEAGKGGAAGRGAAGRGGGMAVPLYGAPIPEYGAPPPPKD